jgi:hypothetical protein
MISPLLVLLWLRSVLRLCISSGVQQHNHHAYTMPKSPNPAKICNFEPDISPSHVNLLVS